MNHPLHGKLDSSSVGWGRNSLEGLSTSTTLRWRPAHKVLWLVFVSEICQPFSLRTVQSDCFSFWRVSELLWRQSVPHPHHQWLPDKPQLNRHNSTGTTWTHFSASQRNQMHPWNWALSCCTNQFHTDRHVGFLSDLLRVPKPCGRKPRHCWSDTLIVVCVPWKTWRGKNWDKQLLFWEEFPLLHPGLLCYHCHPRRKTGGLQYDTRAELIFQSV